MNTNMDQLLVLANEVVSEIKIKRSRFIAHINRTDTLEVAKEYISRISQEQRQANHNCWALIIGRSAEIAHSSDAGEPAGTAGRPILNALQRNCLTNTTAVVTRYFGGVKLGVRGLIEAYTESIEQSLKLAKLISYQESIGFQISTSYEFQEVLKFNLQNLDARITDIAYGERVQLTGEIERSLELVLVNYLDELVKTGKINYTIIKSDERNSV